jgi:hypothetical protein
MEVTFTWNGWTFFANVAADGAVTNVATEHHGRIVQGGLDGLSPADAEAVCGAARLAAEGQGRFIKPFKAMAVKETQFIPETYLTADLVIAGYRAAQERGEGVWEGNNVTLNGRFGLAVTRVA